jgi:flagellar protein FliT
MTNIAAMPLHLALYQQLSEASAAMVEAARANDWERLVDLEREVARLRDALMNGQIPPNPGAAAEEEARRALIQRILDDDAEVRRHTEPWMEQIRRYLGGGVRRREVERAYLGAEGVSARPPLR